MLMSPDHLVKGNLYYHLGFKDVLIYKGIGTQLYYFPIKSLPYEFYDVTNQRVVKVHKDSIPFIKEIDKAKPNREGNEWY